jgi:phage terminase small subunit
MTPKQKLFVAEYIKDFNGSRAAVAAGYSKKTARHIASENLTKPDIQRAIQTAIEERATRAKRTADEVLEMLWAAAEVDPLDYVIVEPDGAVRVKPLEEVKPETRKLLTKIKGKRRITESADGSKIYCDDEFELMLPNKGRIIELLMRYYGLFTVKCELMGKNDEPSVPEGMVPMKQLIEEIWGSQEPGRLWNEGPKLETGDLRRR